LKFSRKKELAFVVVVVVVVFISQIPGSYAIYRRNARMLQMQNFIPAYMKGWTYGRTYSIRTIFSEPKFLGCIDLPKCLTNSAPLHALRARESSANNEDDDDDDKNKKNNKQKIIENLV